MLERLLTHLACILMPYTLHVCLTVCWVTTSCATSCEYMYILQLKCHGIRLCWWITCIICSPNLQVLLSKVIYSKNHNFLRSVGFFAVMAAVPGTLNSCMGNSNHTCWMIGRVVWGPKYKERRPAFLCAPLQYVDIPETWLLLNTTLLIHYWTTSVLNSECDKSTLPLNFRSSPSTGRTWLNPQGYDTKCVNLANIFVMRMLYVLLGQLCLCKRHHQIISPNHGTEALVCVVSWGAFHGGTTHFQCRCLTYIY